MDKQSQIRRAIADSFKKNFAEPDIVFLIQRWVDRYAAGSESKLTFALLDFLRVEVGDKVDADSRRRIYQTMIAGVNKPESDLGPDIWAEQKSLHTQALAAQQAAEDLMKVRDQFVGNVGTQASPARPVKPVTLPPRAAPAAPKPAPAAPRTDPAKLKAAAASMAQGKVPSGEAPAQKLKKPAKGKDDLYGLDSETFKDIFLNHD